MTCHSYEQEPAPAAEHSASLTVRVVQPAAPVTGPAYRVVSALVAAVTGVNVDVLFTPGRSTAPVAAARQLAMYLAHVGLGLPQAEVAHAFHRDRSTVAHACRRIEDMRDKAPFDRHVARMEACLRWAVER